jgi:hypothetical protein
LGLTSTGLRDHLGTPSAVAFCFFAVESNTCALQFSHCGARRASRRPGTRPRPAPGSHFCPRMRTHAPPLCTPPPRHNAAACAAAPLHCTAPAAPHGGTHCAPRRGAKNTPATHFFALFFPQTRCVRCRRAKHSKLDKTERANPTNMPKNSHTTVLHVCVAAPCKTPILAVFFTGGATHLLKTRAEPHKRHGKATQHTGLGGPHLIILLFKSW